MQTILGSSGQIGQELAKELYKNYTHDIRAVTRGRLILKINSPPLICSILKKPIRPSQGAKLSISQPVYL